MNLVDNIYVDWLQSRIFTFFRCFYHPLEKTSNELIQNSKFHDYDDYSYLSLP